MAVATMLCNLHAQYLQLMSACAS